MISGPKPVNFSQGVAFIYVGPYYLEFSMNPYSHRCQGPLNQSAISSGKILCRTAPGETLFRGEIRHPGKANERCAEASLGVRRDAQ